jgi:RimJ/RimL family protein N-acetyltransferase
MTNWLLVRPANPADAEALTTLGRSVAGEPELWMTYDRSRADERRHLKAVRRDPNFAVFVAETPAGIVGRVSIGRERNPYSSHVAEVGLMVASDHRRRGIGSALMQEAVKWARGSGVTKLELEVFPHNEPAIALYRKLGFREEGRRGKRYWVGGKYVDAVLMALHL